MQYGTENTATVPSPPTSIVFKDSVTPHNVAVMLLVNHHLHFKYADSDDFKLTPDEDDDDDEDADEEEEEEDLVEKTRRNRKMCLTALKLINSPDTDYNGFLRIITEGGIWPRLIRKWKRAMSSMLDNGIAVLLSVMRNTTDTITTGKGGCAKYSVLGLYLRRMLLTFDKLTFSQVVNLQKEISRYATGSSLKPAHPIGPSRWTHKEAQQLFSKLLTESPVAVQEKITHLLHHNPDLPEAHFLSFINCVRSRELCGAKESLHECFDRALSQNDKNVAGSGEDRSFRYGTLNLAAMHVLFGHNEEGLDALKETVRLAHNASDSVCLQHALSWLCQISQPNTNVLLHRAMARSSDLELPYLMSLAIQAFTKYSAQTGGRPSAVFDVVMKSDQLNCQQLLQTELPSNSLALRAALWSYYGHSHLSSLYSQLLLRLRMATLPVLRPALCLAICNTARFLADEGEMECGVSLLTGAQELFPMEHTKAWMVSYQEVQHSQLVSEGRYGEAADCVTLLAPLKPRDALIRRIWLHHLTGADVRAVALAQSLLSRSESTWLQDPEDPPIKVRVLLGAAMCLPPGQALCLLMQALCLAQTYFLNYLAAVVTMSIANVMLELNLSERATCLVDSSLACLMSHGSVSMRGRALMLLAHCRLAASSATAPPNDHLLHTADVLTSAQEWLLKAHDNVRLKHCWYLKALVYQTVGLNAERNKSAFEFRQLEEIYPTPPAFFKSFW